MLLLSWNPVHESLHVHAPGGSRVIPKLRSVVRAHIFPKHPTAVAALTERRGRVRGKYHMSHKYRPQMEERSSFSSIKRKERRLQAERLGRSQAVMVQEVRVVPGVSLFSFNTEETSM